MSLMGVLSEIKTIKWINPRNDIIILYGYARINNLSWMIILQCIQLQ